MPEKLVFNLNNNGFVMAGFTVALAAMRLIIYGCFIKSFAAIMLIDCKSRSGQKYNQTQQKITGFFYHNSQRKCKDRKFFIMEEDLGSEIAVPDLRYQTGRRSAIGTTYW